MSWFSERQNEGKCIEQITPIQLSIESNILVVNKQGSIRGLLGVTALCAFSFAAYQYGAMRALTFSLGAVYVLLPTIVALLSTKRFTEDWSVFVVPAVIATVIVLLWEGWSTSLGIVNLGLIVCWPIQILLIIGFDRDTHLL